MGVPEVIMIIILAYGFVKELYEAKKVSDAVTAVFAFVVLIGLLVLGGFFK